MKHLLSLCIFILFLTGSFSTLPSYSLAAPDDGSRAGQTPNPCGAGDVRSIDGTCVKQFIPLVGIPYVDTKDPNLSLAGYVNALYKAAIGIAAFLAVIKIIFAGVKYMLSDVVTTKGDAKKDIRGALIGLLIVIGAVLILNTINPQLKGLTALELGGLNIALETHGCTAHQVIDQATGETQCIAYDNEACDVRLAGGLCGCGERLVGTVVEPGYRCEPAEAPIDPETESQCPYPIQGNCPCMEEPGGYQVGGYVECVTSTSLPEASGNFTFRGQELDRTAKYTINEPAMPEYDLPAGELHGQEGTVVGATTFDLSINGDTGTTDTDTHLVFRLDDGTIKYVGCSLFIPVIPGC